MSTIESEIALNCCSLLSAQLISLLNLFMHTEVKTSNKSHSIMTGVHLAREGSGEDYVLSRSRSIYFRCQPLAWRFQTLPGFRVQEINNHPLRKSFSWTARTATCLSIPLFMIRETYYKKKIPFCPPSSLATIVLTESRLTSSLTSNELFPSLLSSSFFLNHLNPNISTYTLPTVIHTFSHGSYEENLLLVDRFLFSHNLD